MTRGDCPEGDLARVLGFSILGDRSTRFEPDLARVLGANDIRVVKAHGSMIGVPGAPFPGCLAPSHAQIVAPTSPNSPSSWIRPAAFRPAA